MHTEIRILELVKAKMKQKGYAISTQQHYIKWIREYIQFHKSDPKKMGITEIEGFKKYLDYSYMFKTELKKQAIGAIYFLYTEVLGVNLQNEYIQDMHTHTVKKKYVQSVMVF
jgi:predicted Zn-dependent protease